MTNQDINNLTSRQAPWRQELRDEMPAKARTSQPRVQMPQLDPHERVLSGGEVNQGLTEAQAYQEASRCLDCPDPQCVKGCPVGVDIPAFIKNIRRHHVDDALAVISLTSALPAVCGRVCPQERQCESLCIYHKMRLQPVAIGYLERYAADHGNNKLKVESGDLKAPDTSPGNNPALSTFNCQLSTKIAVVGSGPAGLTFAGEMAKLGHKVTVFEALHEIGGVLKYGIPEFRLPNSVVEKEIDGLRALGVDFEPNVIIGKTLSLHDLKDRGYKGIFVASGAGLPRFMNIPGENLIGVMSSNEYLTRINLMGAGRADHPTPVQQGRRVAVIGGGNTAMDSVRTALRMGAEEAYIVYRRGMDEMPARVEEVQHAQEEGVKFLTLHNPVEYLGDERGHITAMRLQRMRLGEPDASGRRSPVPIEGDIVEMPIDQVIVSVGVQPNPLIPNSVEGLNTTRKGTIEVDDDMHSNIDILWAGGDIVRGGATVILAMGDGRRAAQAMHKAIAHRQQEEYMWWMSRRQHPRR